MTTRKQVLESADKAVNGERPLNYGKPEDNFRRIADLWQAHMTNRGYPVSILPSDVAIMLALVKIGRLANEPTHLDSWVDIAGYAACGAEVADAKPPSPQPETTRPSREGWHPSHVLDNAGSRCIDCGATLFGSDVLVRYQACSKVLVK